MNGTKDMKTIVYKCPHCGASLQWDAAGQVMFCQFCGGKIEAQDLAAQTAEQLGSAEPDPNAPVIEEKDDGKDEDEKPSYAYQDEDPSYPDGGVIELNEYTCEQCGAKLYTTEETAATFCSYCGASVILAGRLVRENRPDMMLPFKVTKEQAVENYRKYVKKHSLFTPKWITADAELEKFRGIYMPYWVYRMFAKDEHIDVAGERSYRKGDYIYTDHYRTALDFTGEVDGLHFDASSEFADNLSQVISPFDTRESVEYSPVYMSGYYADLGDVSYNVYKETARETAENAVGEKLYASGAFAGGYTTLSRVTNQVGLNAAVRRGLFPVWFLSIRNEKNRLTYAAVNGQTGEVAADLPVSPGKYVVFSLILSAVLFVLLMLIDVLTPEKTLVACGILALITLIVSISQSKKASARELNLDDEGWVSVFGKGGTKTDTGMVRRRPETVDGKHAKSSFADYWMALLGLLLCVLVFVWKPVNDFYYYLAAALSSLLTALTFIRLIKAQALLSTRKIPQFNQRGGDSDAIVY